MYFDTHIYRKVLAFAWAKKHWPGRNRMLVRLLLVEPALALVQNLFMLLDYVLFPALWRQRVAAPVFIIGHARSGTTLMHRLMAADGERFSYFLYWEMFFPSITLRKLVRLLGRLDERLLGSAAYKRLRAWDERTFAPFRHMHDMSLWNPEEDQFVMNPAFVTQQWQLELPVMHEVDIFHIDRLPAKRRRRWLRFYKECVKRQLVLSGGHKTHLSKNPVMSGWVRGLLEVFPDARFVVMVRDPIQCIPSTLKLVELNWQAKKWQREDYLPALRALTEISFDSFDLPRAALSEHPGVPHCFVDYRDLTRSPKQAVESVYRALGIELSEEFSEYLAAQEEREKQRPSGFEYSIDEYEIDPHEIEERLAEYYERYRWPRPGKRAEAEQVK
ncbi:MAG: sulfotransferase [Deltaproteobacteria bacterium]|nr:MAG: sulfotransferase [Deltaproteobacteria bacterium]